MKKLTITTAFFLMLFTAYSQIDCKPYVPTEKGTKWEITNYKANDKETGKITYELVDKAEEGNDITFTIRSVSYDKKGKETFTNTFEAYCRDGQFEFDMAFKMNGESLQAYQNMDVNIDASEFEIPSMDAEVGTTLEDGSLVVDIGGAAVSVFKMTVYVTDRRVEAREELKTPAGTFDCVLLSQQVSTKMLVKVEASSKEWYAENIGMVRSESYNKKGKLLGYSELTKLELP